MLFILILTALLITFFLFYKTTKLPFFAGIIIFIFIFLAVECSVYTYFVYRVCKGDGVLLLGNQRILDSLYKFRLIYAIYYARNKENYFWVMDDDQGYKPGNNKKYYLYTTNSGGIRGQKEYSYMPDKNVLRIAAFGDSFVFCDDEKDEDTWEHYLENSAGNLEVLNFGVSGYGVNQAYLRYLDDGIHFCPHIVIFNRLFISNGRDLINYLELIAKNWSMRQTDFYRVRFWIENGKLRHEATNVFDLFDKKFLEREIYSKLGFYKNNKLLSGKWLSVSNLTLLLKECYIKQEISKMKRAETPGLAELNLKILEDLCAHIKKNNSILIFVNNGELPKEISRFFEKNKPYLKHLNIEKPFSEYLSKNHIAYADIYNKTNHYNAQGNKIYARVLFDYLKSRNWRAGDKVFYYDQDKGAFESRTQQWR